MKTWFTYIAAFLFAAATASLFADFEAAATAASFISNNLLRVATIVTLPLLVFSFPSAIAALRKDKMGGGVSRSIILWSFITAIILPIVPSLLFYLYPTAFPVTSSAGSSGDLVGYYVNYAANSNLNAISISNPFNAIATASTIYVPLLLVMWIFGAFLNPSSDQIRPAYAVMNSFSEVMLKVARFYTVLGYVYVYFASLSLFLEVYIEKTMFAVPSYLIMLLIITALIILVVLPLLFSIFTRFKKNPYKVLFLSISSLILSLSTGSIISAIATNITTGRNSLGEQKRNVISSSFFFSFLAKGGNAAISTFLTLTLITAMGGNIDVNAIIVISLLSSLTSFASFTSTGMESVVITYLTLKLININLYGAESALLSILMVTNGLGSMIDSAIMALGAKIVSVKSKTDLEMPYKDYV